MKKASSDKDDEKKKVISASIILEIIGKPAEHLIETLENIIKEIDKEKGVEVIGKKINEPIEMKDNKEFYTTFAEVDLEVEDILYLAIVMFKYMPAHVEVIEPSLIALTNNGWTDILSELTRRLHGYEEVARTIRMQNIQMQEQFKQILAKQGIQLVRKDESGSVENKTVGEDKEGNFSDVEKKDAKKKEVKSKESKNKQVKNTGNKSKK